MYNKPVKLQLKRTFQKPFKELRSKLFKTCQNLIKLSLKKNTDLNDQIDAHLNIFCIFIFFMGLIIVSFVNLQRYATFQTLKFEIKTFRCHHFDDHVHVRSFSNVRLCFNFMGLTIRRNLKVDNRKLIMNFK